MKKFKPVLAVFVLAIIPCGFALSGADGASFAEGNGASFAKGNRANIAPETAITAAWMKKAAEKHLKISVERPVTGWRVVDIKTPGDKTLPEDFDEYEVTDARRDSKGKTRVLSFIFYKNSRVIKRLNVTCKLEFFADVVVAKTGLRRGGGLTLDMVEKANRRLDHPLDSYYTEIAQVKGQLALRKIKAGRAILKSETSGAPDVKSGEIVLIVAENRHVTATAKGVARKNGKIGEMIPVVNLRSNKKIYARVTGAGKVEVAF